MTKKDLQKWIEGASSDWVAEFTVPWVASAGPYGREIALKWIESKDEAIASAGWGTYSSLVAITEDADLDLAEIKSLLERVAKSIHQQPNRVKYVMNGFVIAVGCFVKPLHKLAVDTAQGHGRRGPGRFVQDPVRARPHQEVRSTQRDRQEAQVAQVLNGYL